MNHGKRILPVSVTMAALLTVAAIAVSLFWLGTAGQPIQAHHIDNHWDEQLTLSCGTECNLTIGIFRTVTPITANPGKNKDGTSRGLAVESANSEIVQASLVNGNTIQLRGVKEGRTYVKVKNNNHKDYDFSKQVVFHVTVASDTAETTFSDRRTNNRPPEPPRFLQCVSEVDPCYTTVPHNYSNISIYASPGSDPDGDYVDMVATSADPSIAVAVAHHEGVVWTHGRAIGETTITLKSFDGALYSSEGITYTVTVEKSNKTPKPLGESPKAVELLWGQHYNADGDPVGSRDNIVITLKTLNMAPSFDFSSLDMDDDVSVVIGPPSDTPRKITFQRPGYYDLVLSLWYDTEDGISYTATGGATLLPTLPLQPTNTPILEPSSEPSLEPKYSDLQLVTVEWADGEQAEVVIQTYSFGLVPAYQRPSIKMPDDGSYTVETFGANPRTFTWHRPNQDDIVMVWEYVESHGLTVSSIQCPDNHQECIVEILTTEEQQAREAASSESSLEPKYSDLQLVTVEWADGEQAEVVIQTYSFGLVPAYQRPSIKMPDDGSYTVETFGANPRTFTWHRPNQDDIVMVWEYVESHGLTVSSIQCPDNHQECIVEILTTEEQQAREAASSESSLEPKYSDLQLVTVEWADGEQAEVVIQTYSFGLVPAYQRPSIKMPDDGSYTVETFGANPRTFTWHRPNQDDIVMVWEYVESHGLTVSSIQCPDNHQECIVEILTTEEQQAQEAEQQDDNSDNQGSSNQ